jgi:RNA polymerase sigma-70 factor (ECF subfamily)
VSVVLRDIESESAKLVKRIICGDTEAEHELVCRYRNGVKIIIDNIVRNSTAAQDISQDTFRIIIEKLRRGDLRQPDSLNGFVSSVARNAAVDYLRRAKRYVGLDDVDVDRVPDPSPDQFDELLRRERATVVRQIISELRIDRDRQLLSRYFVAGEDKDQICQALGMTRLQFNYVIYRSIARFKELLMSRVGKL